MNEPSSPFATVSVREVLDLDSYKVSKTPDAFLNSIEDDWRRAFPDYSLHRLEGDRSLLTIAFHRDGEFALLIDMAIAPSAKDVPIAIESQFFTISGPLDELHQVKSTKLDMLAVLSKRDSSVVAAHGLVLAKVRTADGSSASKVAQTAMELVFRKH